MTSARPPIWLSVFLLVVASTAALTWWGYQQIEQAAVGVDDSNIFFVYAQHLVDGQGLVWNEGGERVEGYSSTLWMLLIAVVNWLRLPLETSLLILNVLLVSTALTVLVLELEQHLTFYRARLGAVSLESAILLAWVLAVPGYIIWCCLSLMDSGLWSALIITSTVLISREARAQRSSTKRRWALGGLIVALLLARPEGMLWAAFFTALHSAVVFLRDRSSAAGLRNAAALGSFYAATLAALTAFRLAYFGYPLPNTYYAKISPSISYNLAIGSRYLLGFLTSHWLLAITVPAAVWGLGRACWSLRASRLEVGRTDSVTQMGLAVAGSVTLVGLLVPVLVGGDHFTLFRFYQPIWPLLIVPTLALVGLRGRVIVLENRFFDLAHLRPAALLLLIVVFALAAEVTWRNLAEHPIQWEFSLAKGGRETAGYLNRAFAAAQPPSVGVIATGGFAHTYDGEVVDLMGLNLTAMAHQPGDRRGKKNHAAFSSEVFYRLRPDLILPWLVTAPERVPPYRTAPHFLGTLKELTIEPRFQLLYDTAVIRPVSETSGVYLAGLFRSDYLERLIEDAAFDVWRVRYSASQR